MYKLWKSAQFRNRFRSNASSISTEDGQDREDSIPSPPTEHERFNSLAQQEKRNNAPENKNPSTMLLTMSALFVSCQFLKIIPDIYELYFCHRTLNKIGHHCEMDGPVSILILL